LIPRGNAGDQLPLRIDADHRRQQHFTCFVQDARLPVNDKCHDAVGRSQIDAQDGISHLRHVVLLLLNTHIHSGMIFGRCHFATHTSAKRKT
jgi:hypothetical protein